MLGRRPNSEETNGYMYRGDATLCLGGAPAPGKKIYLGALVLHKIQNININYFRMTECNRGYV